MKNTPDSISNLYRTQLRIVLSIYFLTLPFMVSSYAFELKCRDISSMKDFDIKNFDAIVIGRVVKDMLIGVFPHYTDPSVTRNFPLQDVSWAEVIRVHKWLKPATRTESELRVYKFGYCFYGCASLQSSKASDSKNSANHLFFLYKYNHKMYKSEENDQIGAFSRKNKFNAEFGFFECDDRNISETDLNRIQRLLVK